MIVILVIQAFDTISLVNISKTLTVPQTTVSTGTTAPAGPNVSDLTTAITNSVMAQFKDWDYQKFGGKDNFDAVMEFQRLQIDSQLPQMKAATLSMKQKNAPQEAPKPLDVPAGVTVDAIKKSAYVDGSADARILVLEYSDLECPYCIRQFHDGTISQVKAKYGSTVAHIYRTFRGVPHAGAETKAVAVLCAGKLGDKDAYYGLVNGIFDASQPEKVVALDQVSTLAEKAGLSKKSFEDCTTSSKDDMIKRYDAETAEGQKFGVDGTPGNVIVDTKTGKYIFVSGAVPAAQIFAAIDALLGGGSATATGATSTGTTATGTTATGAVAPSSTGTTAATGTTSSGTAK